MKSQSKSAIKKWFSPSKARGFTLVEVLIASVIFAQTTIVGTVTLTSIQKVSKQTRIEQSKQQSVRNPIDLMRRDIHCTTSITIDDINNKLTVDGQEYSEVRLLTGRSTIMRRNGGDLQDLLDDQTKLIPDSFQISGDDASASPFVFIKFQVTDIEDIDGTTDALPVETIVVPRGYSC